MAEEILKIARELDEKGITEHDTESKVLNLSGITVPQIRGKSFVFLQDLVRMGYEIRPDRLAAKLIDEIYKEEIRRGQENKDYFA